MFNIGDKVKFLNEAGGGIITQLIDKDTVMVLSDIDDFEIPVVIKELINISNKPTPEASSQSPILEKSSLNKENTQYLPLETAILLVIEKEDIAVYLCNAQQESLIFGFYEQRKEETIGILSGILEPQSIKKLTDYTLKSIDGLTSWQLQGFYFSKQQKKLPPPLSYELKYHPSKLFKENNGVFVEALQKEAIIYRINNNKDIDIYEQSINDIATPNKDSILSTTRKKKSNSLTPNILEVDLHINELLDTTSGMSNKEMLDYQLNTFRKTLEDNKKNKGRKIVFIHGVGNGILKQRLRHELQKYPRYIVQDASFQQYGWGATMVIIK